MSTLEFALACGLIGVLAISQAILWRRLLRRANGRTQDLAHALERSLQTIDNQSRQIDMLKSLERERDIWRDKYMEDSAGHSAAQAMLIRQIVTLHAAVKKLGGKVALDPTVAKVCNELGLEPE